MKPEFLKQFVRGCIARAQCNQQAEFEQGPSVMAELTAPELMALEQIRAGKVMMIQTEILMLSMQALTETWITAGAIPEWFKQLTGVTDGEA